MLVMFMISECEGGVYILSTMKGRLLLVTWDLQMSYTQSGRREWIVQIGVSSLLVRMSELQPLLMMFLRGSLEGRLGGSEAFFYTIL